MSSLSDRGRPLALQALAGQPTDTVPVALFTWGFDYVWQVAGCAPWQLALGSTEAWHRAHLALVERHRPDLIFYEGGGSGPEDPVLVSETADRWLVRSPNTGAEAVVLKESLAVCSPDTGAKVCDPVGPLTSPADVDRLIPAFAGCGAPYLTGLQRLIEALGDEALVLPHHSPGYVCACYAFGFERAMELMLSEPELFLYACDRFATGDALRMAELAGAGAEVVFIADGWASCDIISPPMFERFALPYQASITRAAHAAGLQVILWNEGDILPIVHHEAALPVEGFAFEQPRKGADLTVAAVRAAFGPTRCLLGNLDSERLLLRNIPSEITRAVRLQLEQSGAGNPFILSTGSPLPSNLAPAAVDTMIQAARSRGRSQP